MTTPEEVFRASDAVSWNTPQGRTRGKVVRKLTEKTVIKGHTVEASEEEPQYLVESDETGAEAAHKPGALTRV